MAVRPGFLWLVAGVFWAAGVCAAGEGSARISGELKKWHRVTVTFEGPATGETATPNPFTDYRLTVTFTTGSKRHTVPGYFAADGKAGESGAVTGNKWRVHFTPDAAGQWQYTASFRTGKNIAVDPQPAAGGPVAFDGASGSFIVKATDKKGRDFRARGMLRYVGKHYLQFAETGEYFLKAGADSPENFLAYADFDGTFDTDKGKKAFLHRYRPHLRDFRRGNPTWPDGRGKGIIGALNYLASKGMNSVYMIMYNLDGGDGKDVWPWTGPKERFRFDCSKLDQWEIVFSHMDRLGIQLHVITQEQENDQGLDGGELGLQRRCYYRELVARFAHHPAVTWNLGEENTNTDSQRKAFARYIRELDPYDHPIVVHTFPGKFDQVYTPLLGFGAFDGPSLQMGKRIDATHSETVKWIDRSDKAQRPWVVCLDEVGPADTGVKPDENDPSHDQMRKKVLWGNLMAGGSGCEWYFGYKYPHNDLNCEDWRSRENMWNQTRYAVTFFQKYLPFAQMRHADGLTSAPDDHCLAKVGAVYAIYLPKGGTTDLKLPAGRYLVKWYNPRRGGALADGSVKILTGAAAPSIGRPPADTSKDWAVVITRMR